MHYEKKIMECLMNSGTSKRIQFKKGELILSQGERNQRLYLLNNVELSVIYHAQSGRRYTIAREKNFNGILGELEIFRDEAKSTFSVICENETHGRYIEKSTLIQLIEKDSSIAIDFIKMISNRYEQNITHSIRVILYRLQYNVIHLLLNKQANAPTEFFHLSITNEASMLGASTRSFRRILKMFIDEGILQKQGRQYRVIDPLKLENLLTVERNLI